MRQSPYVARVTGGLLLVALAACQGYTLFVRQDGVPQNPPRDRQTPVAVGGAVTAAQVFRVDASGFSAVTLYPTSEDGRPSHAETEAPTGDVIVEVWELARWYPAPPDERRLVVRHQMAAADVRAEGRLDVEFSSVAQSRGRFYRVEVSMPAVPDGQGVTLVANAEGGHEFGALWVGDREQWADLAFTTRASGATAVGSLDMALAPLLSPPVIRAGLVSLLTALDILLVVVAQGLWSGSAGEAANERSRSLSPAWLVRPLSWPTLLVVLAAMAAGVVMGRGLHVRDDVVEPGAIALLDAFPDAEKRTTFASLRDAFSLQPVTIDGVRRLSLLALPFSRVTWRVEVPPRAVLRTAVAFRPDSWDHAGDGAMFRIGVSDGVHYEELYRRYLSPFSSTSDRRWFDVEVDLSAFAGSTVSVIFNTEPGEIGNAVSDATVWGAPRIVPHASARRSSSS